MPSGLSVRGTLKRRRALLTTAARSLSRPRPPYSVGQVEKNQPDAPSRSHQSATSSASRARRRAGASSRSMASTQASGRLSWSQAVTSASSSSSDAGSGLGPQITHRGGRPRLRRLLHRRPPSSLAPSLIAGLSIVVQRGGRLATNGGRALKRVGVGAVGDQHVPSLLHRLAEGQLDRTPDGALVPSIAAGDPRAAAAASSKARGLEVGGRHDLVDQVQPERLGRAQPPGPAEHGEAQRAPESHPVGQGDRLEGGDLPHRHVRVHEAGVAPTR